MLLGVNIDHVATLRQARGTHYPEPLQAALMAEDAGADSITIHLREDRRHIQDADVYAIQAGIRTRLNLEMAVTDEMLNIAGKVKPADCCLVPEKRQELTTEGGLDVAGSAARIRAACAQLADDGIRASLFIDPDIRQIDAALEAGAPVVELHTGTYADLPAGAEREHELQRLVDAAAYADSAGIIVNAGHGLHTGNVAAIAAIPRIVELNIGHSIIGRAVFVGLAEAVREIKQSMLEARAA